jgi:hypothetical protein
MKNNKGIVVSGGTFSAEQVAVGNRARVQKIVKGMDESAFNKEVEEVKSKFGEMMEQLNDHAEKIKNFEELLSSVETLSEELKKEKPNKFTISGLLSGIADAVKDTSVLLSVEALKVVIKKVFL